MKFDRHDRATVRAALVLAIDATKNELAASNGEDDLGGRQRRISAERLARRFEDLLERLRKPPEILNETLTKAQGRGA
jgi:hypothetical protein